ncbi:MAG: hypothetical protein ABRQ23_00100 [Syntrophomonadaceae bacterium]
MNRLKVIIQSDEMESPMVYEDLIMFSGVAIEPAIGGHGVVPLGIGEVNHETALATIVTMTQISKQLIEYIKDNSEPELYNEFISILDSELRAMDSEINSKGTIQM